MSTDDKRGATRAPVMLRIKLRYPDVDAFVEKFAVNISRGGMFIRSRAPKDEGTKIKFELLIAEGEPLIAGFGVVRWKVEYDKANPSAAHGMGIEFTRLAKGAREVIERIVAARESQGLADELIPGESSRPHVVASQGGAAAADEAAAEAAAEAAEEGSAQAAPEGKTEAGTAVHVEPVESARPTDAGTVETVAAAGAKAQAVPVAIGEGAGGSRAGRSRRNFVPVETIIARAEASAPLALPLELEGVLAAEIDLDRALERARELARGSAPELAEAVAGIVVDPVTRGDASSRLASLLGTSPVAPRTKSAPRTPFPARPLAPEPAPVAESGAEPLAEAGAGPEVVAASASEAAGVVGRSSAPLADDQASAQTITAASEDSLDIVFEASLGAAPAEAAAAVEEDIDLEVALAGLTAASPASAAASLASEAAGFDEQRTAVVVSPLEDGDIEILGHGANSAAALDPADGLDSAEELEEALGEVLDAAEADDELESALETALASALEDSLDDSLDFSLDLPVDEPDDSSLAIEVSEAELAGPAALPPSPGDALDARGLAAEPGEVPDLVETVGDRRAWASADSFVHGLDANALDAEDLMASGVDELTRDGSSRNIEVQDDLASFADPPDHHAPADDSDLDDALSSLGIEFVDEEAGLELVEEVGAEADEGTLVEGGAEEPKKPGLMKRMFRKS